MGQCDLRLELSDCTAFCILEKDHESGHHVYHLTEFDVALQNKSKSRAAVLEEEDGFQQRYFSWKPCIPGQYPSSGDADGRGEVWIWNGSTVGSYQWSLVKDVKSFAYWMPREDVPPPPPPVESKDQEAAIDKAKGDQ